MTTMNPIRVCFPFAARAAAVLTFAVLCESAFAQDPAPMKPVTFTPKQRLQWPFYRVAVDAAHPLKVFGRTPPVTFSAADGVLKAKTAIGAGADQPLKDGDVMKVELDRRADAPGLQRSFVVRSGDTSAGEPEWSVVALDGIETKIGTDVMTFVDHDADGTFMTPFRDFMVKKGDGALSLVAPKLVIGKNVYDFAGDEAKAAFSAKLDRAFASPDYFQNWSDVTNGLAHINRIRAAMNLPPFGLLREQSRAALLHCRYCTKNTFGHPEDPSKPGYTPEGAKAGPESIGSTGGNIVGSIDEFLNTLFHRMPLIDPRLTEIGIASDGSCTWIEYTTGTKRPWIAQGPSIFPGPNRSWSSATFASERPNPLPAGASGAGLPITVSWYGDEQMSEATGSLHQEKDYIDCWNHDSERKELKSMEMGEEIKVCLMPKEGLRFKNHVLTVRWKENGKSFRLDYAFKIGKR